MKTWATSPTPSSSCQKPATDENLIAHLRQRLAPYKLPRTIERATTPLRDEAGKVRRSALRAERLAQRAAIRQTG